MKRGISSSKKGQITLFLIIGLILLIGAGLFFYLRDVGVGDYKIFQPSSSPVERYVESCMQKVGRDALDKAGAQGGFINLPQEIRYNPMRFVYLFPPEKGTADIMPKVSLWWYDGKSEYPSLLLVEAEIDKYIEENLPYCLNNFESFKQEFDFKEYSNITSHVSMNDKDVSMKIYYELDIINRGDGELTRRNEFVTDLQVEFKNMYELSEEIIKNAVENQFFENLTIEIMSIIPDTPPAGIPFTGIKFDCGGTTWNSYLVSQTLQDAMGPLISDVRFKNTDHPAFLDPSYKSYEKVRGAFQNIKTIPDEQLNSMEPRLLISTLSGIDMDELPPKDAYEYFHMFFDATENENDYDNLKVNSLYREDYGMQFLATPSSNGVMKSSVTDFRSKLMKLLCLNYFHFTYKIRYPITITITDPKAYNGQGAQFKFAYLITIANNEPDKQPRAPEYFEPTESEPEMCDPINRIGKPISIITKDKITGMEIDEVNISYKCFKNYCYLGETKTNNQQYILETQLPQGCSRGILIAEKEGYLLTEKQTLSQREYIDMYPLINFSYEIKKHSSTLGAEHIEKAIPPTEHVVMQISSKNPEYNFYGDYTVEPVKFGESPMKVTPSIELIRGKDITYDINFYLMKEVNGEEIISGGWDGTWTPDLVLIEDSKTVIFPVIELAPALMNNEDPEKMIKLFEVMTNRTLYPALIPMIE